MTAVKIQNTDLPYANKDEKQQENVTEMQNYTVTWKTVWWFFTRYNVYLPNHLPLTLLGKFSKLLSAYIHTKYPVHGYL